MIECIINGLETYHKKRNDYAAIKYAARVVLLCIGKDE